jgi:hypothetical protein
LIEPKGKDPQRPVGTRGQVNGKRRSCDSPGEAWERFSSILDPQVAVRGKERGSKTDSTEDDVTTERSQPIGFMVERKIDFHRRRWA